MAKKHFLGHDKEPPSAHPKKMGGRGVVVHSHSARPKRSIKGGGKKFRA